MSMGMYEKEREWGYLPTDVKGSLSNICTMSPTPCPFKESAEDLRRLLLADPGGECMGECMGERNGGVVGPFP